MNVMNVRIPDQKKVLKAYNHDIQSLVHPESRIIATNNSEAPLRVFPKTSCPAL